MGLLADGEVSGRAWGDALGPSVQPTGASVDTTRLDATQAMATPTLWLLFATRVMTPLGMMMVVPHHVAYLVGEGFDKLTAAFAFGSLGAFSFHRPSRLWRLVRPYRTSTDDLPDLQPLHCRHAPVDGLT